MLQHMVFNFVQGSLWGPGDGSQEKFRGSSAQPISTTRAWMSLAYWSGSLASLGTLPVSVVCWHAHHPFSVRVWETHAQMRARARRAILPYLERSGISKLLIVCHGGIMRALMNQPDIPKIHFCEICELTPEMLEEP